MPAPLCTTCNIELDEDHHVYNVGGVIRPSVTQVLKDAGLIDTHWYTEEARLRGKAVHAACQFFDEDDLDWESVLPPYQGYIQGWARFKQESGFQIGPGWGRPASRGIPSLSLRLWLLWNPRSSRHDQRNRIPY